MGDMVFKAEQLNPHVRGWGRRESPVLVLSFHNGVILQAPYMFGYR